MRKLFAVSLLFLSFGANAASFSIKDLFGYVLQKGCVTSVTSEVKFGDFDNLQVYRCSTESSGYMLTIKAPLANPFQYSNNKHVAAFFNAFLKDTGLSKKEIVDNQLCKITSMPKGASCIVIYADVMIVATAYDGLDYLTITYSQM